jgi:hypothetical protein
MKSLSLIKAGMAAVCKVSDNSVVDGALVDGGAATIRDVVFKVAFVGTGMVPKTALLN